MNESEQPLHSEEPLNADIQCDLAFLSDSIIDAKDGKISAIGIFDRIDAVALPFTLESAMHVVRLRGPAKREVRLDQKVVSPDGSEMASTYSEFQLDRFGTMNVLSRIKNLILEQKGQYRFQAFCDGALIATATLDMMLVPEIKETG